MDHHYPIQSISIVFSYLLLSDGKENESGILSEDYIYATSICILNSFIQSNVHCSKDVACYLCLAAQFFLYYKEKRKGQVEHCFVFLFKRK